jgi:hypothetical protein
MLDELHTPAQKKAFGKTPKSAAARKSTETKPAAKSDAQKK